MNVGFFRRSYYNFMVTQNRAVAPTDYSPFSITAPLDARLPDGGGYKVGGYYDLNQNKVGQVDNFVSFADNFGGQSEHFSGVDFSVNARPRPGVILQGGLSTGATTTDNCAVVRQYLNSVSPYGAIPSNVNPIAPAGSAQSVDMCHLESGFLTQVKLLATYAIPKVDVDIAATFQSLPGPTIAANYVATNAEVQPSLGRPLSGGAQNVTINIVTPGTLYGDRINSLDLRFSKRLRFRQTRTAVNFDLYNAFNGSDVLTLNNSYARWQVPLSILNARLFKVSVQFDF